MRIDFNTDAAEAKLSFARVPDTPWPGNFRDFGGSILRACTLAPRGRVTCAQANEEIAMLRRRWFTADTDADTRLVRDVTDVPIDPFDVSQLATRSAPAAQPPPVATMRIGCANNSHASIWSGPI